MTVIKLAQLELAPSCRGMSSFIFTTTKATDSDDNNDNNDKNSLRVCHIDIIK